MRHFHNYVCLLACLIKFRGQLETLRAKCSSNMFDLSNASWTLSGDVRHLLEMKSMQWWGRGSSRPMDMLTSTQA
ncbi:hypothetical protein H5410_003226 [Solanum commersonii]|uniref:Secreted protein n=1 Tax=Solanum commersonii TaxID=4109 RepID=A0A9J6B436_SOLCO|nr:hypothetical protein H5410_003226 [Solanum commersonii]